MPESHNAPNLLSVKGLNVSISNRPVLHDIGFSLNRGTCLGIVGESGSGKSVSSLSIMGLLPPGSKITAGSINFSPGKQSYDLTRLDEKGMSALRGNEMGMVFQEPMTSLNPVKTCGNQVMEVLRLHRGMRRSEAREECIRLFNEVRLPRPEGIFSSYPHQISGGQKQRVMIAQAIACKPALLIADEPTTALDVTVQQSIILLLNELRQKYEMGMIFITHDLGLISNVADEIVVMRQGRIVEQGSASHIFSNPEHPYTRGLLACRPQPGEHPYRLPTISQFLGEEKSPQTKERPSPGILLPESSPLLEVHDLVTAFPLAHNFLGKPSAWLNAVDNVSLQVIAGETLGLVGESGCGKTSLGRTILRLQEASSGSILFDGIDIRNAGPAALKAFRKRAQIIFQDPYSSLNPRISIGNAIMEPMQALGLQGSGKQRYRRTCELMEQVGLEPAHFKRYPHEFSGGQRQRICIARALAVEPEFIICDESVSALDVSVQAQVLNLLQDLKEDYGLTYIFISHDLAVVEYMSDRIAVMNKGKIIELGPAAEVFNHPTDPYTRKLIDAIPVVRYSIFDI